MVDKLINDYAKQANLPQEIQNIAAKYTQAKKPDSSRRSEPYSDRPHYIFTIKKSV
jgi:hypothetical protein